MARIFRQEDIASIENSNKRIYTDADISSVEAESPDEPSFLSNVKEGFITGKGEGVGGFIGAKGLPIAGGILGGIAASPTALLSGPVGPLAGAGIGATSGEALRRGMAEAITGGKAGTTPMGNIVGPLAEGAEQVIGGKIIGTGIDVAKGVLGAGLRGTSGISKPAWDATIKNAKDVLGKIGISSDDIVRQGQDIQDIISSGKEAIEESTRAYLGKEFTKLKTVSSDILDSANTAYSKAIIAGQELQGEISKIAKMAGEEYGQALKSIKLKYSLDPGAAYPYNVDIKTPLLNTIKNIRDDYGYGMVGRNFDEAGNKLFQSFSNRISNLSKASVEEAYYLQKDLTSAIRDTSGQTISSALGKLKSKVLDVLDDAVPEIRDMNRAYRSASELSDSLSGIAEKDVIAKQIHSSLKYGGNLADSIKTLMGSSEKAAGKIKNIVGNMDTYENLLSKGREVDSLVSTIGGLKETYTLGAAKNTIKQLSVKYPEIKKIMENIGDKEEVYKRLSSVMNADDFSKDVVRIMTEGGNKKDALLNLASQDAELAKKLVDIQNSIFGRELTPWFRGIPQTGMGAFALGSVGVGASSVVPSLAPFVPAFSPRMVGTAIGLAGQAGRGIDKYAPKAGEVLRPSIIGAGDYLRRKYMEQK